MLRGAGKYFGAKVYANFVPHWEKGDSLVLYRNGFTLEKRLPAYAANEKWDMAEDRWSGLYRGTENWKSRAKAASNLALCHEMRGDLKEAYEVGS